MKPGKRYGHTLTPIRHHIYVFGGKDFNIRVNELYDLNLDKNMCSQIRISSGATIPPARNQHTAVRYKDSVIIFGGISDTSEIFNDLSNGRIKDEIFDWDSMLSFQGETGPYVQYIYVRTKSVLEKAGYVPEYSDIDTNELSDNASMEVIKTISNFEDTLKQVVDKNEPSILSRYLIELSTAFRSFYNENKIILDDKKKQDARLYLTYVVGNILKQGANLLGIQMPDRM